MLPSLGDIQCISKQQTLIKNSPIYEQKNSSHLGTVPVAIQMPKRLNATKLLTFSLLHVVLQNNTHDVIKTGVPNY